MNLSEAKKLNSGDYIYHKIKTNADGTPMRAKLTSVKTWKRSPERIELRYKRGLKEFGVIDEQEIEDFGVGYGS